jgi:NADH-quinone oxidoreductase subunit E
VLSLPEIAGLAMLVALSYALGAVMGALLRSMLEARPAAPLSQHASNPRPEPEASEPDVVARSPRLRTTPAQQLAASIEARAQARAAAGPPPPAAKPVAASPAPPLPAPAQDPRIAAPASAPRAPFGAPAGLSGPRGGKRDNLKLIKGIGPRIESGLNDLGVYHFDQIAGWDKKTVVWVENHFSFPGRIGREKWILQARALAQSAGGLRSIKA